ncbi:hypothetical protein ACSBR2_007618 [Camellia fascicularis]
MYRAESSHSKFKRYLGSSQGNFELNWTRIHNLLELQHSEIKLSFEKRNIDVQHMAIDVIADGNCGFRAIVGLMGFGEEGWLQVRKDLLIELHAYSDHYGKLFGSQERIDDLTNILVYFEPNPRLNQWMTMPDMSHLISSFYQVVLIHLSMQQCLTFLPLRSIPTYIASRKEICIGFVNNNHFVQLILEPSQPIPLIATNWRRYHDPCAVGWEVAYSSRVQHFKSVISPDVVTIKTVDLDED